MPKSHSRKLNDIQLVILSSASQREDGLAVLPKGMRAASLKAAVIRLTKLGFLKQVRVKISILGSADQRWEHRHASSRSTRGHKCPKW
jgi:hypothetical protein